MRAGYENDVIHFNSLIDSPLLDKLKIRMSTPASVQTMIRQLIKIYCDCFVEEGVKIPILGFEFVIDTDKYTYVYCKKLHYGPHESRTITK